MCSRQIALSLATLGGIAVIAILKTIRLLNVTDEKDVIIITRKPIKPATNEKDITSQQTTNEKDIVSQQTANEKDIFSHHATSGKDIISQLPDDVLISIIKHMPTLFAVRASILSKRWRNLHKFVSDISFCCEGWRHPVSYPCNQNHLSTHRMRSFLESTSRPYIHSVYFMGRLTIFCQKMFEQCISSLGIFGVEELVVHFSCHGNFSCCRHPHDSPFSCHLLSKIPSLKHFQLASCILQPDLQSPCNSLHTLSLVYVTVPPGALECILSHCLSLHSLIIDCCDCPSKLCFRRPDLRLKSLIVQDCEAIKEIKLYASNLITFEFHNSRPNVVNFKLDHAPLLQSMHLDSYNRDISSYVFGELAKDSPDLRYLAFHARDDFDQGITRGIETFSNLRRLELKVYCTLGTNMLALAPFLESCPLLQEFHVSEFHLDTPYNLDCDWDGAQYQHGKQAALHAELKKVKIRGFCGTKDEVGFALYILKTAVSLEQMHIVWHPDCYYDYHNWRKMIEYRLQGQALSRTARVIINYVL